MINYISLLFVPAFIVGVVVYGLIKKTSVYEVFVEGAKQGIDMAFHVMPYVVAFVFAVSMFEAAGGFALIAGLFAPVLTALHIPAEILPLAITRPFSGNAAFGMLANIFQTNGPDSFVGRVAATLMGSSETLFYTTALYFGSVGISRTRYTVPAALLCEVAGLVAAVVTCSLLFG